MATYHQCLVLLATFLLVGLLPQTFLGQGEQHVNINFIVVYVGGCEQESCSVCTLQTISLM